MRLLGGTASVVALLCVASCGDDTALRSAPAPTTSISASAMTTSPAEDSVAPTDPPATAAPTTGQPTGQTTGQTTVPVPSTVPPAAPTNLSVPPGMPTEDRADQYLEHTTEIYRRTLPDGHDFVVRLSDDSYATVFGLTWTAPTGSATTCLGDRAVFIGVPDEIGAWGSAWVASPWYEQTDPVLPARWQATMSAADDGTFRTQYVLIRATDGSRQVVLSNTDGTERDRASVNNGVAMVAIVPDAVGNAPGVNQLRVAVIGEDGQLSEPAALSPISPQAPAECGPGPAPVHPLPPPGTQPTDAAAAEAQIRERYGLLVDQSIISDQKPTDLLDDNTGVPEAVEKLHSGQYADVAANATYSVDELVFTKPDEAWFRYTIKTSLGDFTDRFGIAVFNGSVWQTTRATICQDLALAGAQCEPAPPPIEAPSTPEWDAAYQEWMARAMQYTDNDGCPPLSQC